VFAPPTKKNLNFCFNVLITIFYIKEMAVFKENLTSKVLQDISLETLQNNIINTVLEIGCGDGNITKHLINNNKNHNTKFHCSDISKEATEKAKLNLSNYNCKIKTGSMFEPWKNDKFDLIISDVSSLADEVADKSNWYQGITCDSGKDGLKNINKIIEEVFNFLNDDGFFILPMISLSDISNLEKKLSSKFTHVSYSDKKFWPIPEFFKSNIEQFNELKKIKLIDFEYKFGIYQAYTYGAVCKK